jgi:hypothetical protein
MLMLRAALVIGILALDASAQTVQLQSGTFRVLGWKPDSSVRIQDLPTILAIYTGGADAPPVIGTYSIEEDNLVFRPRFPLVPGVSYRAVLKLPGRPATETLLNARKPDSAASTRIEHVYPSANVLPSNALRLYIYFSAPMSRGEAWKRIHLIDENGKADPLAFLVAEELWDTDYQRLTVFFDPGRIKRGVRPNLEMGPPISDGKQYTLVIDREFLDANGLPLKDGFKKPFRGTAAERESIDTKQWRLNSPRAGTVDALEVNFPKPLDYALLQRCLKIPAVSGTVSIDHDETRWRFIPAQAWMPGDYTLSVDVALEDLAGNRIDRPFDVDTSEKRPDNPLTNTISLPFHVGR